MKRIFAIIFICMGIANMSLVFSVLNTTLAVIQKDIGASTEQLQWILNVYGIFIAPFLVIAGRFADKFGYKKIFCIGSLFLTISTLGTTFAPTAGWIIFFQIFFGLAGAILLPVSQVLLIRMFKPSEENKAMALWTTAMGITLGFGPIVAGVLTEAGSWRFTFGLLGLVALISFVGSILSITEPARENPPRLDIKGTILLMLTIACFVFAVMETGSLRPALLVGLYVLSIIFLITLLVVEKKVRDPIIQEYLFKNRNFVCASIANGLLIFYVWSYLFLVPLYLQSQLHYSILQTGLIMLTLTIPLVIVSHHSGKLYEKLGAKKLVIPGYILLILTTIAAFFFSNTTSIWYLILPNVLFGLGWAIIMPPAATAAMSSLDKDNSGAGAGTFNTVQEVGGVVGLTIVVTVVRLHSHFISGLHEGFYTLFIFAVIGLISALCLRPSKTLK